MDPSGATVLQLHTIVCHMIVCGRGAAVRASSGAVAPKDSSALDALGEVLRARRAELGKSQEQLDGLHRNVVGSIERGSREPSLSLLLRLAAALDMTGAELIERVERERAKRA